MLIQNAILSSSLFVAQAQVSKEDTTKSTPNSTKKKSNLQDSVPNFGTKLKTQTVKPGLQTAPASAVPSLVHLRFVIDSIQIFRDHDGGLRADGEWHLYGILSCCGGAVNSNMPTKGFSFNSPGATEGEIDTPDNQMNDVRGEYAGMWGTVETVKFNTIYQDIDVDNTNPLTEIQLDLFGVEDDALKPTDLPGIPDVPSTEYDDYARIVKEAIIYLNNLKGADDLGKVHKVFNRANNYGVGSGSLSSDLIYKNLYYKTKQAATYCPGNDLAGYDCTFKDWPDYPDYIINYHIEDREKRCEAGFEFQYATGECKAIVIE